MLKECIDGVRHHYRTSATARSAMAKWIRLGKLPGITATVEDGKMRLYMAPEET